MSNAEQNIRPKPAINTGIKEEGVSHLNYLVARWKRRFIKQQLLMFLPTLLAFIIATLFILISFDILSIESAAITFTIVFVSVLFTKLALIIRSENYSSITLNNLIAHLNNRFDELEDSAQLLLVDEHKLLALEKLQQGKVLVRLGVILEQQAQVKYLDLSPKFAKRKFIFANILLVCLILLLIVANNFQLFDKAISWFVPTVEVDHTATNSIGIKLNKTLVDILSQQVIIEPPSYSVEKTQAPRTVSELLDIDTLVGSNISWVFTFSAQSADYFMVFSNGERQQLVKKKDGTHQFQAKLNTSMVYHLAVENTDSKVSEDFATIHRISLTPDQAPKIRFINPKSTVTEYGKNSRPYLAAQVQISDDFAIAKVSILASIAKGSGEGVKFRDQAFTFDRNELIDGKMQYYKNWSLTELAMEPGDELYFSIVATDNRHPDPQQTRSATKIIRWLEEEKSGITVDGILIDFIPEFFKSQRQIIIETIELIDDKTGIDRTTFNKKSELLGVAQSGLKEKYGQYLGDEFEGQHNVGVTFDESHSPNEQHKPQIQVHDEKDGSSNAVITSAGEQQHVILVSHEHESDTTNSQTSADVSGRMALINRYGHNHEDSDVGVMTSQDPRALMKKSLANMWQAELHLMLSEPELALPFEQQALKLLNLAKKAERIYVKRLGFEPPPVTEQRRYQGEQTDILSKTLQVSRFQPAQLSDQTQLAFHQLLQRLNKFSQQIVSTQTITPLGGNELNSGQLTADDLALVEVAKSGIEKLIDKRPALVELLAVIEQILLERQLNLSRCDNCIMLLAGKLEQLLPNPISSPHSKMETFFDQQPMVESYSQFLEDNL
ncbi:hypothetical protein H4J38_11275 [Colwellia sp. BRX10-3]|uniref:hypothetical protein n=1 Tax=Colwellia sp. BRX10-3 TaxID=2759844 RepID=UPI0015F71466|nr:hypothetical protein [Colwellia sp. BRX10-3]MBA6391352.1 hypothetical protein [Colwellia sp. BRX10-3]